MNELLLFLSALGVFHGFFLCIYLFFYTRNKTLSKYLLVALILALSIRIGKSVLYYFNPDLPKVVLQIGLSACIFIGPLLYFYLNAAIHKVKKIPLNWKLLLLGLFACVSILGSVRSYHSYPTFWNAYVVKSIYVVWFLGLVASSFVLFPILKKAVKSPFNISDEEKWLTTVFAANVIIAVAFFLAIFGVPGAYYITGPLVFSFFIYLLAFGYFNNRWFENSGDSTIEKYQNKKIDKQLADQLFSQLDQLMSQRKVYTNPKLKLQDLAKELSIPHHQLSQLLNDNLGKSYKTFLNEYRVDAACEMLGVNHQMSLEGIGYEVGFRSKSTFYTTFKKMKGLTPAQFQQQNSLKTPKKGSIL